jgi:phenylacetate-CoA ligase
MESSCAGRCVGGKMLPMRKLERVILQKKRFRSDSIWTKKRMYGGYLSRIPVYLDTKALLKSQYWDRPTLEEMRDERIRETLISASRLPFWRARFETAGIVPQAATPADLTRLPILSKKDFLMHDRSQYVDVSRLQDALKDHTSGSTGMPFEFFIDREAELRSFAICERMFKVNVGRRYQIIGMRSGHKPGFAFYKYHLFYLQSIMSVPHRIDDLIECAQRYSGCILYSYPSAILAVAKQMQDRPEDLRVRAAIGTGESLSSEDRTLIERNLRTKMFTNYASRDCGYLAFECEHKVLHLNEEWAYVEIVDAEGVPVALGQEGRIVVTLYDNRVMPLIRYAIGDHGVITAQPCVCGRTLRTIRVVGRQSDNIDLGQGRIVPLLNVSVIFNWYGGAVRQFQIVQTAPVKFTVRVIPGELFDTMREDIQDRLVRALHPEARISWETVEKIEPTRTGKAIYFVKAFTDRS